MESRRTTTCSLWITRFVKLYVACRNFGMYWNIKASIQRPRCSLHETPFTFSLLIKICTTASKFYSFLRTSISIYRKKWKSDVYGVPNRAGKTFASPTHRWGQKVLPTGEARTYSYVGEKFSVLRVGGGGGRGRACAVGTPQRRRASPAQDFISDARMRPLGDMTSAVT